MGHALIFVTIFFHMLLLRENFEVWTSYGRVPQGTIRSTPTRHGIVRLCSENMK